MVSNSTSSLSGEILSTSGLFLVQTDLLMAAVIIFPEQVSD